MSRALTPPLLQGEPGASSTGRQIGPARSVQSRSASSGAMGLHSAPTRIALQPDTRTSSIASARTVTWNGVQVGAALRNPTSRRCSNAIARSSCSTAATLPRLRRMRRSRPASIISAPARAVSSSANAPPVRSRRHCAAPTAAQSATRPECRARTETAPSCVSPKTVTDRTGSAGVPKLGRNRRTSGVDPRSSPTWSHRRPAASLPPSARWTVTPVATPAGAGCCSSPVASRMNDTLRESSRDASRNQSRNPSGGNPRSGSNDQRKCTPSCASESPRKPAPISVSRGS